MSAEIRGLLRRINDSWLGNDPEVISKHLGERFHQEMVIKGHNLETLASGRDACIRSYLDFVERAKVSAFSQDEPDIQVVGDTAIATYEWTITYTLEGKDYTESGHDVFVFIRTNGKWLAIWRAALTGPAK